jgi:hypothetical protein
LNRRRSAALRPIIAAETAPAPVGICCRVRLADSNQVRTLTTQVQPPPAADVLSGM